MIYQSVSEMSEILPLAISNIARLCNKFNHTFALLIFTLRFKCVTFYHDRPQNYLIFTK